MKVWSKTRDAATRKTVPAVAGITLRTPGVVQNKTGAFKYVCLTAVV